MIVFFIIYFITFMYLLFRQIKEDNKVSMKKEFYDYENLKKVDYEYRMFMSEMGSLLKK